MFLPGFNKRIRTLQSFLTGLLWLLPPPQPQSQGKKQGDISSRDLVVWEVWLKTGQMGLSLESSSLGSVRTRYLEVGGNGLLPKNILSFHNSVL